MISKVKQKLIWLRDNKSGSEATEMVASTAMLVVMIMVGLMVLSYIVQLNNCNFAVKRVVREIEVTGRVTQTQMENRFNGLISAGPQVANRAIRIYNVEYVAPNRIQLKKTFTVTGSFDYIIQLINPGSFTGYQIRLPVSSTVSGMSEVYYSKKFGR